MCAFIVVCYYSIIQRRVPHVAHPWSLQLNGSVPPIVGTRAPSLRSHAGLMCGGDITIQLYVNELSRSLSLTLSLSLSLSLSHTHLHP